MAPQQSRKAPKYQHYTPRVHLKHFEGQSPKGMIWAYDKATRRVAPTKITETGGQTYYYSVRKADGQLDHRIEDHLARIEGRADLPYETLLAGDIPTGQQRADFAAFLATLHVRSPATIRAAASMNGKMMQHVMNAAWGTRENFEQSLNSFIAATGTQVTDRDRLFEFWRDKDRFRLEVLEQSGLTALGAADGIGEILFSRSWYLLHAGEGFFVTGDQPVAQWSPNNRAGFADPDSEVTFPLSPRVMLLVTARDLGASQHYIPGDLVHRLNDLRAFEAERFVWSHLRHTTIETLVAEHEAGRQRLFVSGESDLAPVDIVRHLS